MQREEKCEMFGLLDVHLTDEEIRILEEPYGPHVPTAF